MHKRTAFQGGMHKRQGVGVRDWEGHPPQKNNYVLNIASPDLCQFKQMELAMGKQWAPNIAAVQHVQEQVFIVL